MSMLLYALKVRTGSLLAALAVAALAGACAQGGLPGSELGAETRPEGNRAELAAQRSEPARAAVTPDTRAAEPADKGQLPAAVAEARRLRQAGDRPKALEVLDKAALKDAKDTSIMRERGMLALEQGQVDKARTLLKKVVDQGGADWRTHSAYGAALSASGKQQEAQLQFARALELSPEQASVLNNLALSYALDGKHEQAEALLRRVALGKDADARSRQNLALILGLKGNQEEAQKVSAAVLPPDKARANARLLQGKQDDEPAPPAKPAGPVASDPAGGKVKAAAASAEQPTYRLGGPRE